MANETALRPGELKDVLLREIAAANLSARDLEEVGTILEGREGVARVCGLTNALAGEMREFRASTGENIMGQALSLEEDNIGAVILGNYLLLKEGDEVRRTSRVFEVPVGRAMVGRVVDPLGAPMDGRGPIKADGMRRVVLVAAVCILLRPVMESTTSGIIALSSLNDTGAG